MAKIVVLFVMLIGIFFGNPAAAVTGRSVDTSRLLDSDGSTTGLDAPEGRLVAASKAYLSQTPPYQQISDALAARAGKPNTILVRYQDGSSELLVLVTPSASIVGIFVPKSLKSPLLDGSSNSISGSVPFLNISITGMGHWETTYYSQRANDGEYKYLGKESKFVVDWMSIDFGNIDPNTVSGRYISY